MAIDLNPELTQIAKLALQHSSLWELLVDNALDLKFRVQSVSLPFIKFETQTRKSGSKHYTAYVPEEDFSITFLETSDFATYDYFKRWQDQIYDYVERVWIRGIQSIRNFTLAFSRDLTFGVLQEFTGERKFNKAFRMENVKLKGIDPLDLNYENGDPLIYTVNFIADRIFEVPVERVRGVTLGTGSTQF